jgi:hypothetical protein
LPRSSVQELWGHLFFNVLAPYLLRAEAAVVGTMLEAVRSGTIWRDATSWDQTATTS